MKRRGCRDFGPCLCASLLIAAAACGPNDGDRIFDARENAALLLCDCPDARVGTRDECVAEALASEPSESERACIRRIYDRNGEQLQASGSCTAEAAERYERCVRDAACDETALRACDDALDSATAACPVVPEDIQVQLLACFM